MESSVQHYFLDHTYRCGQNFLPRILPLTTCLNISGSPLIGSKLSGKLVNAQQLEEFIRGINEVWLKLWEIDPTVVFFPLRGASVLRTGANILSRFHDKPNRWTSVDLPIGTTSLATENETMAELGMSRHMQRFICEYFVGQFIPIDKPFKGKIAVADEALTGATGTRISNWILSALKPAGVEKVTFLRAQNTNMPPDQMRLGLGTNLIVETVQFPFISINCPYLLDGLIRRHPQTVPTLVPNDAARDFLEFLIFLANSPNTFNDIHNLESECTNQVMRGWVNKVLVELGTDQNKNLFNCFFKEFANKFIENPLRRPSS
jgi:hypothetical protein